jgi:hypothetical protein
VGLVRGAIAGPPGVLVDGAASAGAGAGAGDKLEKGAEDGDLADDRNRDRPR